MRRTIIPALFILSLLSSTSHANVVGADTQNFNPTTNGLDFVTVHSSETLEPGLINFGFYLNYAVNTLPNYVNEQTQTRTNVKDRLLSSDLNFGVGILQNWDFGFSFPAVLSQTVDESDGVDHAEYANTGLTEIRANTKYRLWGDNSQGIAGIFSINMNQIQDNPYTGANPGPTYNFEFAGDTTLLEKWAVGVNVGYRVRNSGEQLVDVPEVVPFGNQWIMSAATSYLLTDYDTKIIAEVFGSFPAEQETATTDRSISSMELLVGMKTDLQTNLAFHAGFGTELIHGTASPDWRVYTGINWVIGPLFSEPKELFAKVDETNLQSLHAEEDPFQGPTGPVESFVARDILFEFNSSDIRKEMVTSLLRLVSYLQRNPGFKMLTIEGHTDSVGNAAYNLDLSQRRAESVRAVLLRETKLSPHKVRAIGRGEQVPIADNGNYQGRSLNRRVEFKIQR